MSAPSLKSPLKKVQGYGSAHNGTHHYMMQRFSAMLMIPLALLMIGLFGHAVVFGGYDAARDSLHGPVGIFAIMFLGLAFFHGTNGLQTVFEDYIKSHPLRLFLVLSSRFVAVTFALIGIVAVLKILLSGGTSNV